VVHQAAAHTFGMGWKKKINVPGFIRGNGIVKKMKLRINSTGANIVNGFGRGIKTVHMTAMFLHALSVKRDILANAE
jgi:hypothetical protein